VICAGIFTEFNDDGFLMNLRISFLVGTALVFPNFLFNYLFDLSMEQGLS